MVFGLKGWNLNEIMFDSIIIILCFMFDSWFNKPEQSGTQWYFLLGALYLFPWYLGVIWARTSQVSLKWRKIQKSIFFTMCLSLSLTLMWIPLKYGGDIFITVMAFSLLIFGIVNFLLAANWQEILLKHGEKAFTDIEGSWPLFSILSTGALAGIFLVIRYQAGFIWLVAIFVGLGPVLIIAWLINTMVRELVESMNLVKVWMAISGALAGILYGILFYLIEVIVSRQISIFGFHENTFLHKIVLLTFSGFIPFRIILFFTPPVSIWGAISGVIMLAWFLMANPMA